MIADAGAAHGAQLCGWLVETVKADDLHEFALWMEADANIDFFYRMTGAGIVTEGMKSYSPGEGTYSLQPKRAETPWSFGTTLSPPGDIDIVAEIHAPPKSVFSDEITPILASFTFRRHVPEGEKRPPSDFAKRQCAAIPASR